jgi:hypothetical protein
MLSQAKKSLNSNPAQALAYARQHAKEYPDSQLIEQRVEIEVLALCKLGRNAEAQKAAARKRSSAKVKAALKTCR